MRGLRIGCGQFYALIETPFGNISFRDILKALTTVRAFAYADVKVINRKTMMIRMYA